MRRWTLTVWLACVIATGLGCGKVESTQQTASPGDPNQTYVVRGRYEGRAMEGQAMRVAHEAIPGYMAAMTMDFPVRDTSEVADLTVGDKIEFTLTLTETDGYAHDIHTLDPGTKLELHD